jgi:hypothetical protein
LFGSISSSIKRSATVLGHRHRSDESPLLEGESDQHERRSKARRRLTSSGLLGTLFSKTKRKRERSQGEGEDVAWVAPAAAAAAAAAAGDGSMMIQEEEQGLGPVRLNFLFVGAGGAGQTSLLL